MYGSTGRAGRYKVNDQQLEDMELELLIQAIHTRYGYDFRSYTRASFRRRVMTFLSDHGLQYVSECIPLLLRDEVNFSDFVQQISVPVSDMFRDPQVYRTIRELILPFLKTYPFVKIWSAGCASGEEAYSLAILALESGIRGRIQIYATDFNDKALEMGKQGIYDISRIKDFTNNYLGSGGKEEFSTYYTTAYNRAILKDSIKKMVTFSNHNLVSDGVFGEMHLILCRNVLIYFDRDLQNRVLSLLTDSLGPRGYLCLGSHESLRFSEYGGSYEIIDEKKRIYQKKRFEGSVSL